MHNEMNPGYFSFAAIALKPQKYMFLKFVPGRTGDIRKHQNSKTLCSNRNNSSMKMSVCYRLHMHRKLVYKFNPNESV